MISFGFCDDAKTFWMNLTVREGRPQRNAHASGLVQCQDLYSSVTVNAHRYRMGFRD